MKIQEKENRVAGLMITIQLDALFLMSVLFACAGEYSIFGIVDAFHFFLHFFLHFFSTTFQSL